jgi:hypothetical protein
MISKWLKDLRLSSTGGLWVQAGILSRKKEAVFRIGVAWRSWTQTKKKKSGCWILRMISCTRHSLWRVTDSTWRTDRGKTYLRGSKSTSSTSKPTEAMQAAGLTIISHKEESLRLLPFQTKKMCTSVEGLQWGNLCIHPCPLHNYKSNHRAKTTKVTAEGGVLIRAGWVWKRGGKLRSIGRTWRK